MTAISSNLVGSVGAPGAPARWMKWTGRVLTGLPVGILLLSASGKLSHAPQMVEMWVSKFGYPAHLLTPIGLLEVACAVLLAIPRTAVLGAILVAGYLAAAFATHLRVGDPGGVTPIVLAVMAWAGLWLRDARLRALLPLRSNA